MVAGDRGPDQVHRRHVKQRMVLPGTVIADCWYCQKAQAVCHSKIHWYNMGDALDAAESANVDREWKGRLLLTYRCPWCFDWHLKTARGTPQLKRVERMRRKWIRKTLAL